VLQIYLYGPTHQGFLNVNPETVLDVEEHSEPFDENLSIGTYTLPTDIPWTENNRKLFGFSERLENFNRMPKQFKCDVYDDGFPEMISAQLTILEKNGTFSYSSGSFSASIAGTKGLFGTLVKNKKLTDLVLGGPITWTGKDSRQFAYDVMTGVELGYPHISFAPVAIEGFIQTDRPDYTEEFLARDTVNTIVINGAGTAWEFGRPTAADPNIAANPGEDEYVDYRTVPFFNLKYVLKKVFEENNFKVTGAFVDGTDFDDLYIFNNYGIEDYLPWYPSWVDLNKTINPANHVPDISIADFLRGLFALFNIYPTFQNAQEVKLVFRKNLLSNKQIFSLNEFVDKVFNSQFENSEPEDGYTLDYQWDSADQYYSDRVKDLSDKTYIGSVRTFADLETLDPGRALTTNDYAYVEADNLYYLIANSLSTPKLWDAYAENLDKYVVGNGDAAPEINISPLATYVEFDSTDALYEKQLYVGTRQAGSYINNKKTLVKNPFGLRLFYIKTLPWLSVTIPMTFTHNRDKDDNVIEPYSLAWSGDYGLAKNFHNSWQLARQNGQVVKTSIKADHKIFAEIQKANCLEIDNILYLPYKLERTIPHNGTVKIHLMLL